MIKISKKVYESAFGYKISREGLTTIEDYVVKERAADFQKWKSPALFLSPATNAHGDGRLNPRVIDTVFNEVCILAGVEGHTPHDARHAMGRHLIEKTGNIAAVQRQLGHTNEAYSFQYARITDEELADALDNRLSAFEFYSVAISSCNFLLKTIGKTQLIYPDCKSGQKEIFYGPPHLRYTGRSGLEQKGRG